MRENANVTPSERDMLTLTLTNITGYYHHYSLTGQIMMFFHGSFVLENEDKLFVGPCGDFSDGI